MPKLVIFRGDAVENEIRLSGNTLRIGRHNRNDVVLDDSANGVSRFHAEIRPEGNGYAIVDLNSRNGIWINGRRIKEKAPLMLGVPVTLGGFELTVEDDASTGEFDPAVLLNNAPTVVAGSAAGRDVSGQSASRSRATPSPLVASKRQMYLWTALGAVVLAIGLVTFAVVHYKTQAPPPVVAVEPAPPPPKIEEPPPVPPEDPNKKVVEQHIADARVQMAANDYAAALREHLQPALELDPENTDALELKKQADEAIAAAAQALQRARAVVKPEPPPADPEVPGIARRSGESPQDYAARVKRVQTAYADGKANFDKNEFAPALSHFRAVQRDQPGYQNVDSLASETINRQQKAVEDAIASGQQNETANKLREARLWYQRALEIDPTAAAARTRAAAVRERMTADANDLFTKASASEKVGERNSAAQYYQRIVDMMLQGDEIRDRAAKRLEAIKR